jgi:hypothetical protein
VKVVKLQQEGEKSFSSKILSLFSASTKSITVNNEEKEGLKSSSDERK